MVNANVKMMERIKKGKKSTKEINMEHNGEKYDFTIRELSSKEILEIQKNTQKGMNVKIDPRTGSPVLDNIKVDTLMDSDFERKCILIAYSLSDEDTNVPVEDVKEYLPNKIINELTVEINKFNGLEDNSNMVKDVEGFQ